MPELMVKEKSSAAWKWIAAVTLVGVVVVTGLMFALTSTLSGTASSAAVEQIHQLVNRQDCVTRINASFFGHLADALSKEPASTQRQDFLNQMKADATALKQLDKTCRAVGGP